MMDIGPSFSSCTGDSCMPFHSISSGDQPPTGPIGPIVDVLDAGMGLVDYPLAGLFTGENLVYSVSGQVVSIDPVTGVLSVPTDAPSNSITFDVTVSNSGGALVVPVQFILEDGAALDQVLDLGGGSKGLFLNAPGLPATLDGNGIWFSAFYYFDGSAESGVLVGLADSNATTRYVGLSAGDLAMRNGGGDVRTEGFATPAAAGWHLVTGHIWRSPGGAAMMQFRRGNQASAVVSFGNAPNITTWSRLALGYLPDKTPSRYSPYAQCGYNIGIGDPAGFHAWVYNGGEFRDPALYDFAAGGASVVLVSETAARADDGDGFDVTDLDLPWVKTGNPTWADIPPPWEAAIGDIETLVVDGAGVSIDVRLPFGDWDAVDVDLSKIKLWATRGYGSLSPVANFVTLSGGLATITLVLNRDVYDAEVFRLEFEAGWLSDVAGNAAGVNTFSDVASQSNIAVPASVFGVSLGKIAYDFSAAAPAGISDDGIMWASDSGAGVQVAAKYPVSGTSGSRVIDGCMKNPLRENDNGYDSGGEDYYVAAMNVNFPQALSAGDSLIGARSNLDPFNKGGGRSGNPVMVLEYGGLIVTDNVVPAPSDFAPPLVGYAGAARPNWRSGVDLAAIVSGIETKIAGDGPYGVSGQDKPDYDTVINRMKRFNPAMAQATYVELRRELQPAGFTARDGYGAEVVESISTAGLVLLAADATTTQRIEIVRWFIHHYQQWYVPILAAGGISPDGGHNQGPWLIFTLADAWVNGAAGVATMLSDVRGNESTAFEIEDTAMLSMLVDPHAGIAGYPEYNAVTSISSVSGQVIRVANIGGSSSQVRDGTRKRDNMVLVRISDGQEAVVSGVDDKTGDIALASNMSPAISSGDSVYFKAPWVVSIGDFDWKLTGSFVSYSPSSSSSYRVLNTWGGEVMVARALGYLHSTAGAMEGYVSLAHQPGQPVGSNDFPDPHPSFTYGPNEGFSGTRTWSVDFWNAHWGTISTVSQSVG